MQFKIDQIVKIHDSMKESVFKNNGGENHNDKKINLDDVFIITDISNFYRIKPFNGDFYTRGILVTDYEIYDYGRILKIKKLLNE